WGAARGVAFGYLCAERADERTECRSDAAAAGLAALGTRFRADPVAAAARSHHRVVVESDPAARRRSAVDAGDPRSAGHPWRFGVGRRLLERLSAPPRAACI